MTDLRAALRSPRTRAAALVVALLVVLAGWLLAAPPGASPDDGYHLGSIWCADGFKEDVCVEDLGSPDRSRVLVPQSLLALTCFTYDGSQSAACQFEAFEGSFQRLVPAATNIGGERPAMYYRAMHVLIGDGQDVAAATARIRVANAVLTALMVLLTALVAHRRLRAAFLLSWAIAGVPLGLFLVTSVNTSAWGIAGLTTIWANAITVREHPRRMNRIAAMVLVLVGVTLGLGSRTEAVAHVAVIAAILATLWWSERRTGDATLTATVRRPRVIIAVTGSIVLLTLLSVLAPASAGLDGLLGSLREGYDRLDARDIGDPFLAIAFEVPTLWAGALGNVWGLGALDTPIPSLASFPLMGVFVGLLAVGLHHGSRARVAAVSVAFLALIVLPTFSLLRGGLLVYEQLQPRQFMVLLFPILGIAIHRLRTEAPLTLERAARTTIVLSLGIAHSVALLVTIQRHTNGLLPGFLGEPRHVEFGRAVEWWWATAPHPDVVWVLASIAYITLVASAVRRFTSEPAQENQQTLQRAREGDSDPDGLPVA